MNVLKSIGAIVAGILVALILSIGTDYLVEKLRSTGTANPGDFSDSLLVVALIYRCIYGIAGAYVTALLAPAKPMLHVVILGSLGLLVSILGTILMWSEGSHWYPLMLVITALPTAWAGGKWRMMRMSPSK